MRIKRNIKILEIIGSLISLTLFISCVSKPSSGTGKWGEVEVDIMRGYSPGVYYEINTSEIKKEVDECGDTNKRLYFLFNEELDYVVPINDPYQYISQHKSLNTKFYLAGISRLGSSYTNYLGITCWQGGTLLGSLICVEKIEEYFEAQVRWRGNGAVVAHEMGHQFGFHHCNQWCYMDSVFSSSNPPNQFCNVHKDSLKNLPADGQLLAFSNNLAYLFSYSLNSVKESLTLYKDTFYEGEPLTFKVWIINKGENPVKVGGFINGIEELFLDLDIVLFLKNKEGEIKKMKPFMLPTLAYTFYTTILPNDSFYYKFTRYITLSPGEYWIKLERGFIEKSRKNEWVPFYVKKYPNKKEKNLAISYFKAEMNNEIKIWKELEKKYGKKEWGEIPEVIYEILKKENKNSPYLPYVGLAIMHEMTGRKSKSMSYDDFKNSEYYKDFQNTKDFPYYEDLLWMDALFLYYRAYSLGEISLFELVAQKLEEAEKIASKYLYIKIWKENLEEIKKKTMESIMKRKSKGG